MPKTAAEPAAKQSTAGASDMGGISEINYSQVFLNNGTLCCCCGFWSDAIVMPANENDRHR